MCFCCLLTPPEGFFPSLYDFLVKKIIKALMIYPWHGQILAVLEGRGSKTTTTPVLVARGGLERSNPATTTTHSGMGVKETHNFMLWEINKYNKYKICKYEKNVNMW